MPAEVGSANGGFATHVPFALPAFHGLEPKLGLAYSSSRKNGIAGAGWALTGVSRIVAQHPKGGVPYFDGTDQYSLDGNLLMPCTGGRCLGNGGTHVGFHHQFERIVRDTVANTWFVTSNDGTVREYGPTQVLTKGTYRWDLTRVRDAQGNVVIYGYRQYDGTVYLDTISYRDVVVTLLREARPDPLTFQIGESVLARTLFRLKSVRVTVGGRLRGLWKLNYGLSNAANQQSRLDSVVACGRDGAVAADGTVTGTCLPPTRFGYEPAAATSFVAVDTSHWGDYAGYGQPRVGDFDGDGHSDLVLIKLGATFEARTNLWNGTGFGSPTTTFAIPADVTGWTATVADLDGDGRSDLLLSALSPSGWWVRSAISDGRGGFVAGQAYLPMPACTGCPTNYAGYQVAVGDPNRDGAVDLYAWMATTSGTAIVRSSSVRGTTWSLAAPYLGTSNVGDWSGKQLYLGDYWGHGADSGMWRNPGLDSVHVADINGDGSDELVTVSYQYSGANGEYAQPTAVTWAAAAGVSMQPTRADHWTTFAQTVSMLYTNGSSAGFADFDGDGRADLYAPSHTLTNLAVSVAMSRGDSFAPSYYAYNAPVLYDGIQPLQVGDFDGDGRSDLVTAWNAGSYMKAQVLLSTMQPVGRLIRVQTSSGGATTVSYRASSAYPNTYLPVGFSLPVVQSLTVADGRGNLSTSTYDYDGGLWNDLERDFVGFARVTRTDAAGTQTETVYHQTMAAAGVAELVTVMDPAGRVYRQTQKGFLEKDDAWPYYALVESELTRTCNLTTTALDPNCKAAQVETTWNTVHGVPVRVDRYGDLGVTGDESTTLTSYVPNDTAFIGSLPSLRRTFQGIGSTGPLLARTTYAYDGASSNTVAPTRGNLTLLEAWHDGPGYPNAQTRQAFDSAGNVTATTDPLGRTSTTTYDATGRFAVGACNALGHCTAKTWDTVLGAVIAEVDANGKTTRHAYDALGRPVQTTYASGGWVQTAYVNVGSAGTQYTQTTQSDGSADGLWARAYGDGLGRIYKEEKEGGAKRLTDYAPSQRDLIARQSNWHTATPKYEGFAYDGLGRVTQQTHADGTFSTLAYGPTQTVATDELGHVAVTRDDALGRQLYFYESLKGGWLATTNTYDALGRVVTVVDAAGNQTSMAYDSFGRKVQSCDPDRGCLAFAYDAANNLVRQTDAMGQVIATTYDALDRPLSKTGGYSWQYDVVGRTNALGRLGKHLYPGGDDEYWYDFAGRVTQRKMVRDNLTQTIGATYDTTGVGRPLATVFGSETVTRTYDTSGNVLAVGAYASGIAYDASGRITSMMLGNGLVESYAYDATTGRLTTHTVKKGTTVLYREALGFDAKGTVTSVAHLTNGVASNLAMTYDELDRLTAVSGSQAQTLAYDALGNITSNSLVGTYAYGSPSHKHAVTRAGGNLYTYDGNGNRLTGGGRTMSWDVHNRLVQVVDASGAETLNTYDGSGQRTKQQTNTVTSYYFGDLVEMDGSTVWNTIMLGNRRLARKDAATGATTYSHQDMLRSTRLMTSATGAVLRTYDYQPFGAVKSTTGAGAGTTVRYGGYRDDSSGLMYLQSRHYDPVLGRFLSPDTIIPEGTPQQLNLYTYANNTPFTGIDPTGHSFWSDVWHDVVATATAVGEFVRDPIGYLLGDSSSSSSDQPSSTDDRSALEGVGATLAGEGRSTSTTDRTMVNTPSAGGGINAALDSFKVVTSDRSESSFGATPGQVPADHETPSVLLRSEQGSLERRLPFAVTSQISSGKVLLRSQGRTQEERDTYVLEAWLDAAGFQVCRCSLAAYQ